MIETSFIMNKDELKQFHKGMLNEIMRKEDGKDKMDGLFLIKRKVKIYLDYIF